MFIKRKLLSTLMKTLTNTNKGVVIYGPRQVGKTTLVNQILKNYSTSKTLKLNADQRGPWWDLLVSRELSKIKLLIGNSQVLFIDEAQRVPEVGLSVKIVLDNFPHLKVILTGSSSLDLASKISEPLTGRVYSYHLYPIWQGELLNDHGRIELINHLERRLVFGAYPEIFHYPGYKEKVEYLNNLKDAYLYKDLLEFGQLRHTSKVYNLLKLLAFQVGSQVSLTELANNLKLSRNTVERYIDLLEKSFIIFRLSGFSRNLRKEVKKMDKIYFWDVGVRNAVIGNFNMLDNRDDVGLLWENFLVAERIKRQKYKNKLSSFYYWRLSSGAELDLVEEEAGKLSGFEFKWTKRKVHPPASWLQTYKKADFKLVNRDNWLDFVL